MSNRQALLLTGVITAAYLDQNGIQGDHDAAAEEFFGYIADAASQGTRAPDIPTKPTLGTIPRLRAEPLDIETIQDAKVKHLTRFTLDGLRRLATRMNIPTTFRTSRGDTISSVTALGILCHRLSYPSRLHDLTDIWGRDPAAISRICNDLVHFIYDEWGFLLNSLERLTATDFERFAHAYHAAGCPLTNVAAMIDATFEEVARPGEDQRALYTGYLKRHAFKFDACTTPDGHIAECNGPIEGRRADATLLRTSGLIDRWRQYAHGFGGRQMFMYGDPAYVGPDIQEVVIAGYKQVDKLPPIQQQFNTEMSSYRESVEWSFGRVFNLWNFLAFSANLKIHLSPVAKYFLVAVLFTNAHTSLYGSQSAHYFQCAPPTLEEYFTKPHS